VRPLARSPVGIHHTIDRARGAAVLRMRAVFWACNATKRAFSGWQSRAVFLTIATCDGAALECAPVTHHAVMRAGMYEAGIKVMTEADVNSYSTSCTAMTHVVDDVTAAGIRRGRSTSSGASVERTPIPSCAINWARGRVAGTRFCLRICNNGTTNTTGLAVNVDDA